MRGWFFWLIVAGVFAFVGHLSYVLFGPEYWMSKKLQALLSNDGRTGFVVLSPQKSAELLPAEDPGLLLSVCRFNLSNGPINIRVTPVQQFWSLSIYSQKGDSYYTINDRQLLNSQLNIVLMKEQPKAGQQDQAAAANRKTEKDRVFINAPSPNGWAIIRIALGGASLRAATIERAKKFSCVAVPKNEL